MLLLQTGTVLLQGPLLLRPSPKVGLRHRRNELDSTAGRARESRPLRRPPFSAEASSALISS
jgi:hypothetical protein